MYYVTPFFQQLYPNSIHINYSDLMNIKNADIVAINFYDSVFDQYTKSIDALLANSKKLHIQLGEPTNEQQFIKLLNRFDFPNVHFYSDCVLNFKLTNASFTPVINWFIDPINCYTEFAWAKKLLANLKYDTTKPFLFDILLGQEKLHRNKLNRLVLASQYKDLFIYSYFKNNMSNGIQWDTSIDASAHQFTSELYQINGEDARPSALIPVDIYNQSYYSVICETTSYNSYNQYTEKVAKPILAKRPFIAFAGKHYLKNLKSLGFKTFDTIIDESYDNVLSESMRFKLAWDQVEVLCQQDPNIIIDKLQPILDYNQQHFLNTDWSAPIKNLF